MSTDRGNSESGEGVSVSSHLGVSHRTLGPRQDVSSGWAEVSLLFWGHLPGRRAEARGREAEGPPQGRPGGQWFRVACPVLFTHPLIHPPTRCPSIHPAIHPPTQPPIHQSTHPPFTHLPIHLPTLLEMQASSMIHPQLLHPYIHPASLPLLLFFF